MIEEIGIVLILVVLMVRYFTLILTALRRLSQAPVPNSYRFTWMVIIFFMPFLGSIVFLARHRRVW